MRAPLRRWRARVGFPRTRSRRRCARSRACRIGSGRGGGSVGVRALEGVPHRLEQVAELDGVVYVNDSKATNVASTLVALDAFEGGVHLIAGGRAKGEDFGRLRDAVATRCRAVYLVGEAAPELRA